MVRRSLLAGLALFTPFAVFAFESVDTLTPSTNGRFLAYPAAEVPLSQYWIQGGVMVDNNIIRRTVSPGSETVARLGLGGRKDTRVYGRQMVRLEGRIDGYIYDRFSELDNIGYGGLAHWLWELGNDLSGVLGVSRSRHQADLSQIQEARRDMITETHVLANGAYRLGPSFRVRGGGEYADFVRPAFAVAETKTLAGVAGIDYVSPLGNTIGLEYRQASGDAPVDQRIDPLGRFVNNDFRQRDLALTTSYIAATRLRVAGRVGRTKRTYTDLPDRDFNGTTWRVTADWLVGNKTALGFETYKEPRSIIDIAAGHLLVRGAAFGPGWAPTEKLNFSARVYREDQLFQGDPAAVLGVAALRHEITRGWRLGSYWEYDRQVHFQFAFDHGERESNLLGRNFRYNALVANARYLFW